MSTVAIYTAVIVAIAAIACLVAAVQEVRDALNRLLALEIERHNEEREFRTNPVNVQMTSSWSGPPGGPPPPPPGDSPGDELARRRRHDDEGNK